MGVATQAILSGRHNGKVALNAAKSQLTLAELASNPGMHQPLAAAWKQQAAEGMAASFNGKMEVTQETSEAELNRLHAKIGQLVFVQGSRSVRIEQRRKMISLSTEALLARARRFGGGSG